MTSVPLPTADLLAFYERNADDAAEVTWLASLAALERAAERAREGLGGRFSGHPAGELRRLRRDVSVAMQLARLAAALQTAESDRWHEATREARAAAVDAGRRARRAQTLPAELARLAKARARRAERARVT